MLEPTCIVFGKNYIYSVLPMKFWFIKELMCIKTMNFNSTFYLTVIHKSCYLKLFTTEWRDITYTGMNIGVYEE